MTDIFTLTTRPNPELFFKRNDPNDIRLGETIPQISYPAAEIVILGSPQDEGINRNGGRRGAALAPDKIREEFYKLTNFGFHHRVCDIGNIIIQNTLEETQAIQTAIVSQILLDGKRLIMLGGGSDLSFADGCAMAENFGQEWLAINVDLLFDVQSDEIQHSGTPYRQLLGGHFLKPEYFYEVGYQTQANSPVYFNFLDELGVNLISLEQLRSQESVDISLRDLMKEKFIHHTSSLNTLFSFDLQAVRASDAPGTSAPNPIGLRAGEFLTLVKFAATLANTKIIEFIEVNPNLDVNNLTAKLVAIAMHRICSNS